MSLRLNDIKQEPLKIISYIIMTFLLSYFTTGNIMTAITLTILSMWFCMMPRLTHEKSFYKEKLPKLLIKHDLINKIISILIPLILSIILIIQYMSQNIWFETPVKSALLTITPLFISIMHYIIFNKCKNEFDWLMPIVVSVVTVFGTEFLVGNLGNYIKNLFPFIFGKQITDIAILWTFLMQVFIVYGIFRLISIIFPGRGLSMSITSLFCFILAFLNHMCELSTGLPFRIKEMLNFKEIVAFIKLIIKENYEVTYIIKCIAIFALVIILTYIFGKKSSRYEIHTRFKSFLCGIGVLCIAVFMSVTLFRADLSTVKNCNKTYGLIYYTANTVEQTNEYSEEWKAKIQQEVDKIFPPEEEKTESGENSENTANETEKPTNEQTK